MRDRQRSSEVRGSETTVAAQAALTGQRDQQAKRGRLWPYALAGAAFWPAVFTAFYFGREPMHRFLFDIKTAIAILSLSAVAGTVALGYRIRESRRSRRQQ